MARGIVLTFRIGAIVTLAILFVFLNSIVNLAVFDAWQSLNSWA